MSSTILPTRTNFYLWLLTGRSGDFANAALNTVASYRAGRLPAEIDHLRALLNLTETSSDFYVLGALAGVYLSPSFLREMPEEKASLFTPGMLSLPRVDSSLAMLPPDGHSWSHVDGGAAGASGFTVVAFQGLSATEAVITTDSGSTDKTAVSQFPVEGGYRVIFEKAPTYGIHAHFLSAAAFGGGSTVTVTLSPTRYPYRAMVRKIEADSAALRVMADEGVLQAFTESSTPAEKVGLLGIAIMRRVLRSLRDEQGGYAVTVEFADEGSNPPSRFYDIQPAWTAPVTDAPRDETDTTEFHV